MAMASSPALFTASRGQTLTYLLAVCPFSIAFLVFINSSVSFVVADLIGHHDGEGDAVGTLGFADELLALAACPIWGVVSDRIGVRPVSCTLQRSTWEMKLIKTGVYHWLCNHCPCLGIIRAGHECLPPAAVG